MIRRVLIFIALCVVAIIAGLYFGRPASAPAISDETQESTAESTTEAPAGNEPADPEEVPAPVEDDQADHAYFYVNLLNPAARDRVIREIEYARAQNIQRLIVPVGIPWEGSPAPDLTPLQNHLAEFPTTRVTLALDLNPPQSWYENNPDAGIQAKKDAPVIPFPYSNTWRSAVTAGIDSLITVLNELEIDASVDGYTLSALEQGRWIAPAVNSVNAEGAESFTRWLIERYGTEENLLNAWDTDDMAKTIDTLPGKAPNEETAIFDEDVRWRIRSDWARFQSESIVRFIGDCTSQIKDTAGRDALVYAPYGFTLELPGIDRGQLALERLLASGIDGLICWLSDSTRGMGDTGAFNIPVNSAQYALKRIIFIDDTRTGLDTVNAEEDDAWPFDTIAEVFERNGGMAMSAGMEIAWADTDGSGALDDERLWQRFGAIASISNQLRERVDALDGQFRRYDIRPEGYVSLTVVVDEESFFAVANDNPVRRMIAQIRKAAIEAGVSTHFTLLSDVLADRAVTSGIYLFANAFHLNAADRERLHAILARDKSTAVWVYAPGYHDTDLDMENVAETVRMSLQRSDTEESTPSIYALAGRWMSRDSGYTAPGMPPPLFTIENAEELSVIARMGDGDDDPITAAAISPEDGWTSIFLADPALPTALLRELLAILEIPAIADMEAIGDSTYFANDILTIHAMQDGPRVLPLQWEYDIVDAIEREMADNGIIASDSVTGWPRTREIAFQMKAGETRIFRLSPTVAAAQ